LSGTRRWPNKQPLTKRFIRQTEAKQKRTQMRPVNLSGTSHCISACPRYKMKFIKESKTIQKFPIVMISPNWTVFMKSCGRSCSLLCPRCSHHLSKSGSRLRDDKP
jgi:NAD-dependent dihydropyrimidine dehydrogenase PreA subunit